MHETDALNVLFDICDEHVRAYKGITTLRKLSRWWCSSSNEIFTRDSLREFLLGDAFKRFVLESNREFQRHSPTIIGHILHEIGGVAKGDCGEFIPKRIVPYNEIEMRSRRTTLAFLAVCSVVPEYTTSMGYCKWARDMADEIVTYIGHDCRLYTANNMRDLVLKWTNLDLQRLQLVNNANANTVSPKQKTRQFHMGWLLNGLDIHSVHGIPAKIPETREVDNMASRARALQMVCSHVRSTDSHPVLVYILEHLLCDYPSLMPWMQCLDPTSHIFQSKQTTFLFDHASRLLTTPTEKISASSVTVVFDDLSNWLNLSKQMVGIKRKYITSGVNNVLPSSSSSVEISEIPEAFRNWVTIRQSLTRHTQYDKLLWSLWCFLDAHNHAANATTLNSATVIDWMKSEEWYQNHSPSHRNRMVSKLDSILRTVGIGMTGHLLTATEATAGRRTHVDAKAWWYHKELPPEAVRKLDRNPWLKPLRAFLLAIVRRLATRRNGNGKPCSSETALNHVRAVTMLFSHTPDEMRPDIGIQDGKLAMSRDWTLRLLRLSNEHYKQHEKRPSRNVKFIKSKGISTTMTLIYKILNVYVNAKYFMWNEPITWQELSVYPHAINSITESEEMSQTLNDQWSVEDDDSEHEDIDAYTNDRRDYFNPDEMAAMHAVQKDSRQRLVFHILYTLAPRISALCGILLSSVWDSVTDVPLQGRGTMLEKGSKRRTFPIAPIAAELCDYMACGYQPGGKYLFPARRNFNTHMTKKAVECMVARWCRQANVVGNMTHPHAFRKSWAQRMHFTEGWSMQQIATEANWESEDMVLHYLRRTDEDSLKYMVPPVIVNSNPVGPVRIQTAHSVIPLQEPPSDVGIVEGTVTSSSRTDNDGSTEAMVDTVESQRYASMWHTLIASVSPSDIHFIKDLLKPAMAQVYDQLDDGQKAAYGQFKAAHIDKQATLTLEKMHTI
jgi:hypothetical protein